MRICDFSHACILCCDEIEVAGYRSAASFPSINIMQFATQGSPVHRHPNFMENILSLNAETRANGDFFVVRENISVLIKAYRINMKCIVSAILE